MKPVFPLLYCFFLLCFVPGRAYSQSPDEIIFQTEGSSFSPLIQLKSAATVLWTFSDGTTSSQLNPAKEFGTTATRSNRLAVNPWSSVKMINIGYDAGDGGAWDIPFVTNQYVSKVTNLSLVKDYLEVWCSSYNQLDTLSFDDFSVLHTIECFLSQPVRHVSLQNTPALTRLCLEDNNLGSLDISGCTSLMDLRGAVNNYPTIQFSNSTEEVWHICVRDNPQITNDSLFSHMEIFPGIAELFIWNCNQRGNFRMSQNNPTRNVYILADGNHYSSLDLRGSFQNEAGHGEVSFGWNGLTSVDISGCDQIKRLYLYGNWMPADTVDKILRQLDEFNTFNGIVNLTGNEIPTEAGMVYKASLESRGWTVDIHHGPEINVLGNGIPIADGDYTPSVTDSTDFGNVFIGETITRQFVIQNTGNAPLNGWEAPPHVFIYGPDAAFFTIADSIHFPIAAQSADTLRIGFSPSEKRSYTAEIYMTNNDDNEAPFNFAIRATGKIDNAGVIDAYKDITDEILFLSEGSSFSPLIQLNSEAEVIWTFADETVSNSLNPNKNYGSGGSRMNSLKVTPWNAVQMINIGFDGGDGGWWWFPHVPNQQVSYLQNQHLVKDSLKYWCSSYNLLDSLILDNFGNLEAVECFLSGTVTKVSLKNTPALRRLCLEDNNLSAYDISESTSLEDIRGALNNYSTISFSNSTDEFWHICVRDNPQVTNDSLFAHMEMFPNIAELFIWNMNQGERFNMAQNHPTLNISILADGNHYASLDLRGSLQNENGYGEVYFGGNQIRSVELAGCDQIRRLNLAWNGMASDTVDKVLRQLDEFGTSNGTLYLVGNEIPGSIGLACKQNLENRGWVVEISGPVMNISGNGQDIVNGDDSPSVNDNTEFGLTNTGGQITREFVIRNQGNFDLNLSGNPVVSLSGPGANDFTVTTLPASTVSPWGSTTSFQITFSPSAAGLHETTVTIPHDGVNTISPYTFSIQGIGDTLISDTVVGEGDSACFGSETNMAVAGNGLEVIFQNGSFVNLIARESIDLLPGLHGFPGSYTHAWITTDDTLCKGDRPTEISYVRNTEVFNTLSPDKTYPEAGLRIYPNPNNGSFTLQIMRYSCPAEVTIINPVGEPVYKASVLDNREYRVNLDLKRGLYFVTVRCDDVLLTRKLIVE